MITKVITTIEHVYETLNKIIKNTDYTIKQRAIYKEEKLIGYLEIKNNFRSDRVYNDEFVVFYSQSRNVSSRKWAKLTRKITIGNLALCSPEIIIDKFEDLYKNEIKTAEFDKKQKAQHEQALSEGHQRYISLKNGLGERFSELDKHIYINHRTEFVDRNVAFKINVSTEDFDKLNKVLDLLKGLK